MALVGFGHGTSHFFHLVLPSLFPWLMAEFGLSFTRAGALATGFFVVSGVAQAAAGFAVDRYGARRALWLGLALLALSALVLGMARGYPTLLAAALLAGAGNSVFHPADFTLLNHRVSPARLGLAFSAHGLAGSLGWAAAPVLLTAVASAAGWRAAAFVAGGVALLALSALVLLRPLLAGPSRAHQEPAARGAPRGSAFAFLAAGAVWSCFLYFLTSTMGFGALQNFAPSVLKSVYGLSIPAAASALSSYLLGGAAGIAVGGVLASRFRAHENVVAVALVAAALLALVLATGALPGAGVAPLMALVGFCASTAAPSRDLLVRRAAMERFGQRSFGRIYGFVYSGFDVGLSVAPIVFGRLMDRGMFRAVLAGVALFQGLAVVAALRVGRERAAPVPVPEQPAA